MSFFRATAPILGMNARNLLYISKYNSASDKRFADNKLFTKQFLSSRNIGVAKLFHHVKQKSQLTPDFFRALPKSFVIKPNKGFAGAGISVIKERIGKDFLSVSGKRITTDTMYQSAIEILEGKYSISGVSDSIIFEEMLYPHSDFRNLTEVGLPDVRVIVFNNIPVLAMLRVPTYESDGKANMELGALGLGIDMGTGKTTGGAYYKEYVTKMPNGTSARGFQIPYWDEILDTCSKIQLLTKIGFLGVDMVITPDGLSVLELNARSGLKIQIANQVGLRRRLDQVRDLNVITSEQGVDIAKKLFSSKTSRTIHTEQKPIIGLISSGRINGSQTQKIQVKVNLQKKQNTISLPKFTDSILDITIAKTRIKIPIVQGAVDGADIEIGSITAKNFLIDPSYSKKAFPIHFVTEKDKKILQSIDEKIENISSDIKLLSIVNPKNISEQRTLFLSNKNFNPIFEYKEYSIEKAAKIQKDIEKIPSVENPIGILFDKRKQELLNLINLLQSVNTDSFTQRSEKVFQRINEYQVRKAQQYLETLTSIQPDESNILNTDEAINVFAKYLKQYNLAHWEIVLLESSAVDVQVTKKQKILVRKGSTFTENRLKALLVHEIGTHVFRYENGRRQPYRILSRGTAGYLQTEEGLAVWNQNQLGLNLGEKQKSAALHIVTIQKAYELGIRPLHTWLINEYGLTPERAWHHCLKAKRGTKDPNKPGAFTKDAIYFNGLRDIEQFIEQGGEIKDLYMGKFCISDLEIIQSIPNLKRAKWTL